MRLFSKHVTHKLCFFSEIEPKVKEFEDTKNLSALDNDPDLLTSLLKASPSLNSKRVQTLMRFNVNLDPAIQHEISLFPNFL